MGFSQIQGAHSDHGHECSEHGHGGHNDLGHECSGHSHGEGHGHGAGHGQGQAAGDMAFPAIESLMNSPQFAELRATVQRSPESLPQMLAALSASNPGLRDAIEANQEEFLAMLQSAEADGSEEHGLESNEQAINIPVSAEDQAAVDRLKALGFSADQALEAYLACDRKEELAANFLFDSM